MGKLECSRCGGIIEHDDFMTAVETLDHAVGKVRNRPCPNDPTLYHLIWNGIPCPVIGRTVHEPKGRSVTESIQKVIESKTPKSDSPKETSSGKKRPVPSK